MLTTPTRILFTLLIIAISAPLAGSTEITNPSTPANGLQVMPMEELWRIGGEDDEENLLGVVDKVFADDDGQIYLLDIQLVEVQVFDTEGIYSHSLGKKGEGPGEIQRITDALFLPDGTVGLVQSFPGKIVQVSLDGTPAGEFKPGGDDPTAGGFFAIRSAASVGNKIVINGGQFSRGEKTRTAIDFLGEIELTGKMTTRYKEKTTVREFGQNRVVELDNFFVQPDCWAITNDGRVVLVAERNEYKIEFRNPDGSLNMVVTRDYESVQRSAAEIEKAEALFMPWRRRNRSSIDFVMESTEPDILQIHVADDGRLWVLPSSGIRNQAEGVHSTWDIFDQAGQFERQIAFACDADGQKDALFFPGGDLVVIVKEHTEAMWAFRGRGTENPDADESEIEPSPLEVICYRIAPSMDQIAE